jgi:hypothetical protein
VLAADTLVCQRVDVRAGIPVVAVAAQVVRPQAVDVDVEDAHDPTQGEGFWVDESQLNLTTYYTDPSPSSGQIFPGF